MQQNVIAMIYDFDRTLSPAYMEKPMFERFGIDETGFWTTNGKLIADNEAKGIVVDKDTSYLHLITEMAKKGQPLEGLTRDLFQELGGEIEYFPGLPEFFKTVKTAIEEEDKYAQHGIKIEHYVVSTGLMDMMRGSIIAPYMEHMAGCEFFYDEENVPKGVARGITHTQKTQILFQINKGVHLMKDVDANTSIDHEFRRVPFQNMIFYGDGPSDVPCMSVIKRYGGTTFAVYEPDPQYEAFKEDPMRNAFDLLRAGRANFCLQANYNEGSDLYMTTIKVLKTIADRIVGERNKTLEQNMIASPGHHSY